MASYIYWRTQVGWQVSPALGQTLVCAAFQFSTQRQLSLHLPVYVRGIGSADRTSAIGLEVKRKQRIKTPTTIDMAVLTQNNEKKV